MSSFPRAFFNRMGRPGQWVGRARAWARGLQRARVLRVLLSDYVLNGASCALGMLLASLLMRAALGPMAAATATIGVIATLPPDLVTPRRGKLATMMIAPFISLPLFLAVQLLRSHPAGLGMLLVPATFLGFLCMAWGKRGAPVAIGVMLMIVFSMSTPVAASPAEALERTLYCTMGCALYVVYSVLANYALNGRYRTQLMADLLLAMAALLRAHARRLAAPGQRGAGADNLGELLQRQATLADQLQATRNVVLEAPNTPHRQRLAGMLMVVLEMRDHLVAGELDLDRVHRSGDATRVLRQVALIYRDMARDVIRLADALLLRRLAAAPADHGARLAQLGEALDLTGPMGSAAAADRRRLLAALLRGLAFRITHQNAAIRQLFAVANGSAPPDLAVVRNSWRLFVSPTELSIQPFFTVWHWRQPALRHAVRAALAVGAGYGIATLLPWAVHDYWILLTIVVVLRGSLAQTLERRNARVLGTLLGSLLAVGILALEPSAGMLMLALTVAQGVTHGFAMRRYWITAMGASVLGLIQSHMLLAETSNAFAFFERVADTLIGAGIAWAFSYVLPSWERGQIAALVRRVLKALNQHARASLSLADLKDIDTASELAWRLARREAYDALSALVQAAGRALAEPRAVQPPLALLEHLQGHSYQLLAQLSAVKSMLLLRRDRVNLPEITAPLNLAAASIEAALATPLLAGAAAPNPTTGASAQPDIAAMAAAAAAESASPAPLAGMPEQLPDPFLGQDINPWVLRRLHLSAQLANHVRLNAQQTLAELDKTRS
ncbi:MAG: FUSC family protein [Burkholderiaceae bacterium]|nr:FUSC family protein [Burkholderiaceae bacterium]